jgi:hypothetical protein
MGSNTKRRSSVHFIGTTGGPEDDVSTSRINLSKLNTAKQQVRPMTSIGCRSERATVDVRRRPRTATGTAYSSHDVHKGEMDGNITARSMSCVHGTLTETLAQQQADDLRQDLLDDEYSHSCDIEQRRQAFLNRTSKWVEDNPAISSYDPDVVVANLQRLNSAGTRRSSVISIRSDQPVEQEIRNKLDDAWKDLKKCRYIRVNDDEIDLSGINTLARDQYSLFQSLRTTDKRRKPCPPQ